MSQRPVPDSGELPAAPRFAWAWAALAYVLATFSLAWPVLGGKFLVNPRSDQYLAGFAFRDFAAQALRAGEGIPHWNPFLFGGMPYVAAMHGDIWYPPTVLLRLLMPTDVAMSWGFIVHLFLCGFLAYLFLRRVGLAFLPALVGGMAYMMSGKVASYVSSGHDGKLFVSSLLPLALLLLHAGIREGKRWAWGALALTIALQVLTPHIQVLQYSLVACGAWGLWLAFSTDAAGAKLPGAVAARRLLTALGAVGLGMVAGAVQFLPVMEYVGFSPRSEGGSMRGWEHAVSYSMPPEELINTLLPEFVGLLEQYWGRNGIHFHSEYIGVVVLVLGGLAYGRKAGLGIAKSFVGFWTGVAIVATLWSVGGYTPFYRLVYALVPGTKFFRAPDMMFYVAALAVAVLAAVGTERLLRGLAGRRYLYGWAIAGGVVFLLAISGGLTNLGLSIAGSEAYDRAYAAAPALRLGAVRMAFFLAVTLALLFATMTGRVPARVAGGALAALLAVDLWTVERKYWEFSEPAATIYGSDPTIEYLKKLPQPARVLSAQLTPEAAYHDPFLNGDVLMGHGLRQTLGYHGNELKRYQDLYGKEGGGRNIVNPNFLFVTNTQYLLTNDLDLLLPGMTRVVGPVRNAAGTMVALYRFPGENPFAWVAPAIVKAPDDQVLATVLNPRFDPTRAALFDTSAAVQGVTLAALPPRPTARVTMKSANREQGIVLELSEPAAAGSALIVSENYYPGWTATVDGRPATVGRAQYSLLGVPLTAGARTVALRFESAKVNTGFAITVAAMALGLVLLLTGAAMDRRRPAPSVA